MQSLWVEQTPGWAHKSFSPKCEMCALTYAFLQLHKVTEVCGGKGNRLLFSSIDIVHFASYGTFNIQIDQVSSWIRHLNWIWVTPAMN